MAAISYLPIYRSMQAVAGSNIVTAISQKNSVTGAINLTSESVRQYGRTKENLVFAQELKPRYLLGARYRF